MINLEQIQKLEARVTKAVELIKTLKTENQSLRKTVDSAQSRMQELEKLVNSFKNDQKDIERCILRALENLNELEDEINEPTAEASSNNVEPAADEGPQEETEDEEVHLPFEAKAAEGKATGEGSGELDIF